MAAQTIGLLRVILTANTAEFDKAMKSASKSADRWSKNLGTIGRKASQVGGQLTRSVTLPLVGIAGAALKASVDFESSFAGIRKTVNATEEQFGKLAQGMRDLSKQIPINVNELNRIGEAAGQLGIKTENILGFTEVMAKLGVTTNLSADQAATSLARFANIVQMPQDQFDRLGSTIVDLGNNFATTEADLTEFGLRIAGAGKIAGLSESEILAIGAAMSSIGVQAEAGGTAVQKVLNAMTEAVAMGGGKLETFAATAGMSAEEFQRAFRDDAAGAFTAFVKGLGEQGDQAFGTLKTLKLGNERVIRAFVSLAGAGDLLERAISTGNEAWRDNTALTKEAETRFGTTASELTKLWNRTKDLGITLGDALVPALKSVIRFAESLVPLIEKLVGFFTGLPTPVQNTVIGLTGIAALSGPVLSMFGGVATLAKTLIGLFGEKTIATRALAGAYKGLWTFATSAAGALTLATSASIVGIGIAKKLSDATHDANKRVKEGKGEWSDIPAVIGNAISRGLFPFFEAWKDGKEAVEAFRKHYPKVRDTIIQTSKEIYEGVRDWLVTKFKAIVDSIKEKVGLVSGAFKELYDKVIGNSFVPDLVEGIRQQFGRLDDVMVKPSEQATTSVGGVFMRLRDNVLSSLSSALQSARSFKDGLISVLDALRREAMAIINDLIQRGFNALVNVLTGRPWQSAFAGFLPGMGGGGGGGLLGGLAPGIGAGQLPGGSLLSGLQPGIGAGQLLGGAAATPWFNTGLGGGLIGVGAGMVGGELVGGRTGNKFGGAGAGAAAGAATGFAFGGPVGALIGGIGGGLWGWYAAKRANIKANDIRDQFFLDFAAERGREFVGGAGEGSTFNQVAAMLTEAGHGAGGGRLFQDLIKANDPTELAQAIAAVNQALAEYEQRKNAAAQAEAEHAAKIEETKAAFENQIKSVQATLKSLDEEEARIDASEAPEKVMGVREREARARIDLQRKHATEQMAAIEEAMEKALGSIGKTAEGTFDGIADHMGDMRKRTEDEVGRMNEALKRLGMGGVFGGINIEFPEAKIPGFATGTPGLGALDFGPRGSLAMLHNREHVIPEDRAGDFAARFGGDQRQVVAAIRAVERAVLAGRAISVQVDGKEIARATQRTLEDNPDEILTDMRETLGVS